MYLKTALCHAMSPLRHVPTPAPVRDSRGNEGSLAKRLFVGRACGGFLLFMCLRPFSWTRQL